MSFGKFCCHGKAWRRAREMRPHDCVMTQQTRDADGQGITLPCRLVSPPPPCCCNVTANPGAALLPSPPFARAFFGIDNFAVRIDDLEHHVEAPKARDMFQDLVRLIVERPPQILAVSQRKRAITARVD